MSSCEYFDNTKQEMINCLSSMLKVSRVQLFVWLFFGMHFKMCKLQSNQKQTIGCCCFFFFYQSLRLIGTVHVCASASTSSEHNVCMC